MERRSALASGGQSLIQEYSNDNPHRSVKDFTVVKIVGKGSFGVVRQCQSVID